MIKKIGVYFCIIFFIIINSLYGDEYITSTENRILTLNKKIAEIQAPYKMAGQRVSPYDEAKIVEIRYDIDMMKFNISLKRRNLLPKKDELQLPGGYPELEENPLLVIIAQ